MNPNGFGRALGQEYNSKQTNNVFTRGYSLFTDKPDNGLDITNRKVADNSTLTAFCLSGSLYFVHGDRFF